jgi:hypothetical protein
MSLLTGSLPTGRSRWRQLCLGLAVGVVAVLVTGCVAAGQTQTPAPTVTPLPIFATLAADPGWAPLAQRPLHLPVLAPGAVCPHARGHLLPPFGVALGSGPAYPILAHVQAMASEAGGVLHYVEAAHYMGGHSGWGGEKVLWVIDPAYHGFVLIRGQQIDGPHALGLNGGVDQPETYAVEPPPIFALRLVAPEPGAAGEWANWPSQARLQAPGCSAYQVDGSGFSHVIVFQAVPAA